MVSNLLVDETPVIAPFLAIRYHTLSLKTGLLPESRLPRGYTDDSKASAIIEDAILHTNRMASSIIALALES